MEELFELRTCIEQGRYEDALVILGEMEEMSRDDKINKIGSFLEVLLLHLIKQHAENRSTRSWRVSVSNSVHQIMKTNKRRKSGGHYLDESELREAMEESYPPALRRASLEAFEGMLDEKTLGRKVDAERIKEEAMNLILEASK